MQTILIATSEFGSIIPDFYKKLGDEFKKYNYKLIYIFDNLPQNLPNNCENTMYFTWPSAKPTKIKDFVFLFQLLARENPAFCLSNFESTNVVSIISYLFKVKTRVTYIHTNRGQIILDKKRNILESKFWWIKRKIILGLNTHYFTNSHGTKLDLVKGYRIPREHISVLPLLISHSKLKYKLKNEREFCIVIVGRLHPSKGHKNLLKQFSNCLSQYPKLVLKIVGDGHLKEELKALAKTLKVDKNVVFTGFIPNNCIDEVYSSAFASVSSSIHEAYGLNNIEALREGTPLICTKTTGSADILTEGKTGNFIDMENPNSLSTALGKILSDWNSYSQNSLAVFKKKYSLDNIGDQFKKIKHLAR